MVYWTDYKTSSTRGIDRMIISNPVVIKLIDFYLSLPDPECPWFIQNLRESSRVKDVGRVFSAGWTLLFPDSDVTVSDLRIMTTTRASHILGPEEFAAYCDAQQHSTEVAKRFYVKDSVDETAEGRSSLHARVSGDPSYDKICAAKIEFAAWLSDGSMPLDDKLGLFRKFLQYPQSADRARLALYPSAKLPLPSEIQPPKKLQRTSRGAHSPGPDGKFSCPHCNTAIGRSNSLTLHLKKFHPDM